MVIKGPLPRTYRGFQYILVVQEAFSRYAEMFGMLRQTAEEVCEKLREWIGRYGIFHSDNGPYFVSRALKDFCGK